MAAKRSKKTAKRLASAPAQVTIKPRNPFAQAAVTRKGGAHRKTEQALRKQSKDQLVHSLRRLGKSEE